MILGPAGAGKSALASQYAAAAARRGERAAMFVFDERVGTLIERADALGMDMRAARRRRDASIVQQIDPAEMGPGEFASARAQAVERDGVHGSS